VKRSHNDAAGHSMGTGDPYVIVRGGGVDNQPALPVLDLRFLEGYPLDAARLRGAKEALRLARTLDLPEIVEEIQDFLSARQPSGRRRK
jgi:hypothetical protein